MEQLLQNVQGRIKDSSKSFGLFMAKTISGLFLGLTLALVTQELFQHGTIIFWFVILITTVTLLKVSRSWSFGGLLIFNLICVLCGMLLRMYILLAPGQ
jgi:hypothetical protein